MLHMPCPMLLGGDPGAIKLPNYAAYRAHLATLTSYTPDWSADASHTGQLAWRCQATTTNGTGVMYGSPWLSALNPQVAPNRVAQHAVDSFDDFSYLETAQTGQGTGVEVYFRFEILAGGSLVALNRNGYLSIGIDGNFGRWACVEVIFWRPDTGRAYRRNPSLGTPYQFYGEP
ncbi:hypothetical protein [uncultured Brevundimonas sp.]|uniref:hypothetical protein n=1 Tax=uncultured Brevundimonas sp. TaxID=213418 RepID=UPI0025FA9630|nr:hypothetical protein [uncultured Brevundimonas sp.]